MNTIAVQVVYALPDKQYLYKLSVPIGSTVLDVIKLSPILKVRSEIELDNLKVGVYSRIVKLTDIVKDGDRVEIYRPLVADPKELRRKRAKQASSNES